MLSSTAQHTIVKEGTPCFGLILGVPEIVFLLSAKVTSRAPKACKHQSEQLVRCGAVDSLASYNLCMRKWGVNEIIPRRSGGESRKEAFFLRHLAEDLICKEGGGIEAQQVA